MGLTKQYLRYEAGPIFNIVASLKSHITFVEVRGQAGNFCACGAAEDVIVWNLKTGDKFMTLKGESAEAITLTASPDHKHLAVGYSDGSIRIFSMKSAEVEVVFSGHKTTVTSLSYDQSGMRLVSGAYDTDVIVWNIVDECGLYRLKGHKGQITQARFMIQRNILITSSKDTRIKFWDLDTQHCFKTLTGHVTEIWDFALNNVETRLYTGSGDNSIRVWRIAFRDQEEGVDESLQPSIKKAKVDDEADDSGDEDGDDANNILTCEMYGTLTRKGRDRVLTLMVDRSSTLLACHGTDAQLELFHLHSEDEIKRRLMKRQKRVRKRQREKDEDEVTPDQNLEDEITRIDTNKMSAKLRSVDVLIDHGQAKVCCLLNNNTVSALSLPITSTGGALSSMASSPDTDSSSSKTISLPGHRSDIRTLTFSSDNTTILSASADCVKIWNRATQHCIRTMECGYALSSLFAPGDRHALIGTKSGKIQIFDIAAGEMLEEIDAHTEAVWSMDMAPDKRGLVSGSKDKTVKFWLFELLAQEENSARNLSLLPKKVLEMPDDVLCVRYSPNHKLLAVSLLDYTVKVFFADSLKFFLTLYGHKLPVLCMDISTDSSLIVTGSADRNVKIWGLDFGDCHKSIYAHDDSIMDVRFVPKTHMFFTVGKDRLVKEWDADNFNHIQTLKGHHAEVWTLAISPSANLVVTSSHDRTMRIWTKTQEPLILEEEQETEREKEDEKSLMESGSTVIAGEASNSEVSMAGKKTIETVKSAERMMEAVDVHKEETDKVDAHQAECKARGKEIPAPPLHPHLIAHKATTPDDYFLVILKKIKSSDLDEALISLPFSYVTYMMSILSRLLTRGMKTELVCRCLFFLLRVHHGQITSSRELIPVVEQLKAVSDARITEVRDTIGFNMAALHFLEKRLEENDGVTFFMDATRAFKEKKSKAKQKVLLSVKT